MHNCNDNFLLWVALSDASVMGEGVGAIVFK